MGRLAKVLSFLYTARNGAKVADVKVDPGAGENITGEHFAAPGDDSQPLPGDFVVIVAAPGTGRSSVVGYLDPNNEQKATAGDKRIYSRDGAGAVVAEVWLKNDGTITANNANGSAVLNPDGSFKITTPAGVFECAASGSIKGSNGGGAFELLASGDMDINGVIIDTAGNVTSPAVVAGVTMAATTSLTVAGKEMNGHAHPQGVDSSGDTQQNTGGPI